MFHGLRIYACAPKPINFRMNSRRKKAQNMTFKTFKDSCNVVL